MKHTSNTNGNQQTEQQLAILNQLSRLLQPADNPALATPVSTIEKKQIVITKVVIRPNPFLTAITLDVASEVSRHTIVRMYNSEGRIVKMFSWFLVKGTNVTSINEVHSLMDGTYHLDMIDNEGNLLYSTNLTKAEK